MTDEELIEALDLLDRLTDGLLPLGGPFQVYRERVDTWKAMMRGKLATSIPEDHWGQGDVAMATEEDEAQLLRIFGKTSDELADEAEQTIYAPRNDISDRWYPR